MTVKKLSKQEQEKLNQFVLDLKSKNNTKIEAALKAFSVHGHVSIIEPVLQIWCEGLSESNEKLVEQLLQGLKDTSTIEPLIMAFRNPKYENIQRKLLVTFWNSKLEFSPYLADFTLFAIEGDFSDALEALTVIENFETLPSESSILETQLLLSEYFNQKRASDEQKDSLIAEIAVLVENFSRQEGTENLELE